MDTQLSKMRVLTTLIKREFLEQRLLFVYLPLLGTALAMLLYLYAFVDRTVTDESSFLPIGSAFLAASERIRVLQIQSMYEVPFAALMFTYWGVMAFYFLTTLQQQRRNRSILFWNSMPVSNTQTVLSKLIAGLLCCQVLYLACYLVLVLFLMLLSLGYGWYAGIGWDVLVAPAQLPWVVAGVVLGLPIGILWAIPVYGWLLLVSARMHRLPFVWAAAPIALISVVEIVVATVGQQGFIVRAAMNSWMAQVTLGHALPWSRPDLAPAYHNLNLPVSVMYPWLELGAGALLGAFFVFAAIRLNRPDDM